MLDTIKKWFSGPNWSMSTEEVFPQGDAPPVPDEVEEQIGMGRVLDDLEAQGYKINPAVPTIPPWVGTPDPTFPPIILGVSNLPGTKIPPLFRPEFSYTDIPMEEPAMQTAQPDAPEGETEEPIPTPGDSFVDFLNRLFRDLEKPHVPHVMISDVTFVPPRR